MKRDADSPMLCIICKPWCGELFMLRDLDSEWIIRHEDYKDLNLL